MEENHIQHKLRVAQKMVDRCKKGRSFNLSIWENRVKQLEKCLQGDHQYESAIVLGRVETIEDFEVCIYCNNRKEKTSN